MTDKQLAAIEGKLTIRVTVSTTTSVSTDATAARNGFQTTLGTLTY